LLLYHLSINYTYTTGTYSYTSSYATGAADLTEFPLTISEGADKFGINVNGTYYEIALEQRGYSSLSDLITEIYDKINGINAPAGLKDKVTVSASGSNIRFTPVSGSGISTLSLSAVSSNTGYKDLFVGTNTTYTERTAVSSGTSVRSPQITLNIPIGTVIDSAVKAIHSYYSSDSC